MVGGQLVNLDFFFLRSSAHALQRTVLAGSEILAPSDPTLSYLRADSYGIRSVACIETFRHSAYAFPGRGGLFVRPSAT